MRTPGKEIAARLAKERLMVARGSSWAEIRVELGLTHFQIRSDRKRLAQVLADNKLDRGDAHIAYEFYRDAMMYAVVELQGIIDSPESSTYERIMAIKNKVQVIDQIFKRGTEIGILITEGNGKQHDTDKEKYVMEETKRVSVEGRDLVGNVIERFRKAIPRNTEFEDPE